jgi:hypothetical protein
MGVAGHCIWILLLIGARRTEASSMPDSEIGVETVRNGTLPKAAEQRTRRA